MERILVYIAEKKVLISTFFHDPEIWHMSQKFLDTLKEVQKFQIILIGVLTRVSMRKIVYYFELFREISNAQLENDM